MIITGAQYVLEEIKKVNAHHLFAVPGAHLDPLIEAASSGNIRLIVCCHEASAGFMADGYARANKTIGIVAAIGGPGADNLVSVVNTARIERSPMLIITGDVPVALQKFPAFQCAGYLGSRNDIIYPAITKYSARISVAEELPAFFKRAIQTAFSPPYGPVHLIIPYDILKEKVDASVDFEETPIFETSSDGKMDVLVSYLCSLIKSDIKTVLWAGEALNNYRHANMIKEIAEKFNLPVATTYGAKGIISENHPMALGNFGYAGSANANKTLLSGDVDVVICFDVDQNERNTLNWHNDLYTQKRIVLVNFPSPFKPNGTIDTYEYNPGDILECVYKTLEKNTWNGNGRAAWARAITQSSQSLEQTRIRRNDVIEPSVMMKILREELPSDTILFVDSGAHRIFAGKDWKAVLPQTFFSASVTAPTGWAIAAGIGAKMDRKEPVVIITGDGCMQMHGIEIKTAVRYGIPVIVVLCNNGGMGNIHRRFSRASEELASHALIDEVDWSAFARSLGAMAVDVIDEPSLPKAIRECLKSKKASLINVRIPIDPHIDNESYCKSSFA